MNQRRMRKTERWFNLVYLLLSGARPTMTDLTNRFGVSGRTVYRDLQELSQQGVPIYEEDGRYGILDTVQLRVPLTASEIGLLVTALDFIQRQAQTSSESWLKEKLLAVMPATHKEKAALFSESVVVDPQPAVSKANPDIEEVLRRAIEQRCCVRIKHQGLNSPQPRERTVQPYGLVYRGPGRYLVAFCHLRQELRFFRVNRIKVATLLAQTFEKPADFDLHTFVAEHWGIEHGPLMNVKVRFSQSIASLVTETLWHPSQEIKLQEDGSVILSMAVRGTNEVARWLAGFGAQAEVLQPEELRQAVFNLGWGIVEQYLTPAH